MERSFFDMDDDLLPSLFEGKKRFILILRSKYKV